MLRLVEQFIRDRALEAASRANPLTPQPSTAHDTEQK